MPTRVVLMLAALGVLSIVGAGPASAAPTCSTTLGIQVHGQHIIGDYVTGVGRANLAWPPSGAVGTEMQGGGGVAIAGGPGPGFHFIEGFAPGASFCLDQSHAPGFHPGLG